MAKKKSLLTTRQLSKLVGVSESAIQANQINKILIKDPDSETVKFDPLHPKNREYILKRTKNKQKKTTTSKTSDKDSEEDTIQEYTSMAQQEQKFKVEKLKADVQIKTLLLKEKRGDLVSKKKLGDICFSYLDNLNKNLLVVPQVFIDEVENYIKHKDESKMTKKDMLNGISRYITKAIKSTKSHIDKKMKIEYGIDEDEHGE